MTAEATDGDSLNANPALRDAFLQALDGEDRLLMLRAAKSLVTCANALPGLTREALGLPAGATYGMAARHMLALQASGEGEADVSPAYSSAVGRAGG